jgi:hypothetical protein
MNTTGCFDQALGVGGDRLGVGGKGGYGIAAGQRQRDHPARELRLGDPVAVSPDIGADANDQGKPPLG